MLTRRRLEAAALALCAAVAVAGCSSWQVHKNYKIGVDTQKGVGDPMVSVETFVVKRGDRVPGRGQQQELIYTGRTGNTISVTYREYVNDFARPAFFQDLHYDLGNSDVVVFRKWRLRVLEANNQFIKFQVLSDMGPVTPGPIIPQ